MVVGLRNTLGIKRVGSDDISTSHQVFAVDVGDDIRARQIQLVGIAGLAQHLSYHRAHSTIENQYALFS